MSRALFPLWAPVCGLAASLALASCEQKTEMTQLEAEPAPADAAADTAPESVPNAAPAEAAAPARAAPAARASRSAPEAAPPPAPIPNPGGDLMPPRRPERRAPESQTREQFEARIARGFADLDLNGDGVVTQTELDSLSGGRGAGMIARLDDNNDGRITREEMRAGADRMFRRMDANGDGVITPDERPGFGRGGPRAED